jgi:glutathione-regulated potassium-efflux system ancillary protein KefG
VKTLILFAHPSFHKSTVNKVLLSDLDKDEKLTIHDLYQEYPDFDIDIDREQELVERHDCIIFHFPFFWYSTPALIKEWQDLVLRHDWAYGSKGNKLEGKLFINAITLGGPEISYSEDEFNHYNLDQLLAPLTQTAKLCKMLRLPPFTVYGTHVIEMPEILEHKRIYAELLRQLASNELDIEKALSYDTLNDYITQKND